NRAGNRIYSNKDIKFILRIRELLREKRYTIEGAKQILKDGEKKANAKGVQTEEEETPSNEPKTAAPSKQEPSSSLTPKDFQEIKSALETLKAMLTKKS